MSCRDFNVQFILSVWTGNWSQELKCVPIWHTLYRRCLDREWCDRQLSSMVAQNAVHVKKCIGVSLVMRMSNRPVTSSIGNCTVLLCSQWMKNVSQCMEHKNSFTLKIYLKTDLSPFWQKDKHWEQNEVETRKEGYTETWNVFSVFFSQSFKYPTRLSLSLSL